MGESFIDIPREVRSHAQGWKFLILINHVRRSTVHKLSKMTVLLSVRYAGFNFLDKRRDC
jgi:hypothetical protein